MPDIESISKDIAGSLSSYKADYIELHFEESKTSQIRYKGKKVDAVGRSNGIGGNVRVLMNGGWGFTSFNSLENLDTKIKTAMSQASFIGGGKTAFCAGKPIVDEVKPPEIKNPVDMPLEEKKAFLDEYNEIIWQTPKLKTADLVYSDSCNKRIFINSEGSYISEQRADVRFFASCVAASGGEVQQLGLSMGSLWDINPIANLHEQVKYTAEHAVTLLDAPKVKGGKYTVVLDPVIAGVFVHEAFGHLSESDFIYENERMQELMKMGKVFGGKELSIVDSGIEPGLRGSYKYDDEGTPSQKTYLIKEGELVGRLHSRETATKMKEAPTGNARAVSYRHQPIVRMSNTYIEPRNVSFEDMIADIKEGIYVKNWYGGTTSMEMFTFSAGEAYMIRNGRIEEALRPVVLSGNVFDTLLNIDLIGNDLSMNEGGGCGKGGQAPLPVSNGSPHIRIQKCLVGGA